MENSEITPEEYIEIADKVRSGEYFRDARLMADIDIHDVIADRYWYTLILIIFIITTSTLLVAASGLFPLKIRESFIFASNDIVDDYPKIISLVDYHGENPDVALRRYLIKYYVKLREEYDATTFDRNHNAIQVMSNPSVLEEYEKFISPTNSKSPIALYQRSIERRINIISTEVLESNPEKYSYSMRVTYDAVTRKGDKENQPTRHKVNIAFKYKDIKLNQETEKIEPYGFIVTSYNTD